MAIKLALLAFSLVSSVALVGAPELLAASDLQVRDVSAAGDHPASGLARAALAGPAPTAAHVFWNGTLWLTGLAAISTLGRSGARRTGGARVLAGYARTARARLASERGL
jgi:hypothetical protein